MVVLPESMNKLETNETEKSLSVIENYIRYMGERIEFAMRNITKTDGGVTELEFTELENKVSTLSSNVNNMQGDVTGLQSRTAALETSLSELTAMTEADIDAATA